MANDSATSEFAVGVQVEIHSLSSAAGSRFNGCKGTVTQVNTDGRRVVKLNNSCNLPVVKAMNLRALNPLPSDAPASETAASGIIQVVGLQSEQGRLLNGLLGRRVGEPGKNGRCLVELFASGQCKLLKDTNLVNLESDALIPRLQVCLEKRQLYDMHRLMQGLPNAPASLVMGLSSHLAAGIHSEILGQSLELVDILGKGKGYRATRHVNAGEALLFETSSAVLGRASENTKLWHPNAKLKQKILLKLPTFCPIASWNLRLATRWRACWTNRDLSPY